MDNKQDNLNDSWVELHYQQNGSQPSPEVAVHSVVNPHLSKPLSHGTMEKLLLEAQKDLSSRSSSRGGSGTSSRASPKSLHSPVNEPSAVPLHHTVTEQLQEEVKKTHDQGTQGNTDWILDWASRPDAIPPSDMGERFKHPHRAKLSVRNTPVMRSAIFSIENLPVLLVSHACTFFLGAAAMFIYLKKYCNLTPVATTPVD